MMKSIRKHLADEKEAYRIPRCVRDLIPIHCLWKDGIFRTGQKYSKTYCFTDINYQVAALDDKKDMFFSYSAILNSMDSGATYKITENKRHMTECDIEDGALMGMQEDGINQYRKEYNDFILDRTTGSNGSFLERYLTVSVPKRNIQDARSYFARIGPELAARFAELGSHFRELNTVERLQILHDFYRPEDSEHFHFDLDHAVRMGYDFRDYIGPDFMEKHKDYLVVGSRYARTFYLKGLASYIRDDILDEFTSLNCDLMLSIDILPIQTEEAIREVENRMLGVEKNLSDWQRRQNQNHNYSAQPPYDMELQRKETKEMLDDLTTRDQRMILATISMVITAASKEQLDSLSDTLRGIAQNRMCQIVPLTFQQMDGLNTVLPISPRKIHALRTLTTESLAIFMPFKVQEIQEKGGMYFGENAISHNLILCNKQNLQNQATVIFGVPGSGKSFLTKEQIFMLIANTDDDIMICDPEGEYAPLVEAMGDVGTVLRIRAGGKERLNAMYMTDGYGDSNPVAIKSEFIMSLMEQIDKEGVGPQQKSIIDRCVSALYRESMEFNYTPTLSGLRMKLMEQPEPQAKDIALALELFTTGSLDIFGHDSNVDLEKRVTVFDIHGLGPQLKPAGLLVITDTMLNRVTQNWKRGKRTHVFIDEFHVVFENEFSAAFFSSAWRQFRKRNAYPTAITQNVEYLLDSVEASTLISNSELIVMLNQAASDREKLGKLLNISPEQMRYITNADSGCGLIRYGSSLVPFTNRFPKNTKLYELMTTTPGEGVFSKG